MPRLTHRHQQTDNPFLNMFAINYIDHRGIERTYYLASRRDIDNLACVTDGPVLADAAIIIPIFPNGDVVFLRQYRPAINEYVYELPAGLCDFSDVNVEQTAVRELHEETGLVCNNIELFLSPRYMSVGMCDEACGVYLAEVTGNLTDRYQELGEDISFEIVNTANIEEFVHTHNVSMQASLISLFLAKCRQMEDMQR